MAVALFLSVLLIAACGLIYELIAGTLASYLLGDSVLQFSTVIGSYLFAMGIGSWLSAASRPLFYSWRSPTPTVSSSRYTLW
jgi:predicted membrane-bound spermidine synthase